MSPTIIRTKNLRIRVYPKDHDPAHVHVTAPNAEAKIRLSDCKAYFSKGFTKMALSRIEIFIEQHKEILLKAWHEYQK